MRSPVAVAVGTSLLLCSCTGGAPSDRAPAAGPAALLDAAPPPVDSGQALPPNSGCHPVGITAAGEALFPLVNPEWAPVVPVPPTPYGASPYSTPVLLHGAVVDSHVSREDFPSTHVTFDQNTSIELDPADQGLLATGNADRELELEWETGSYPAWAWAGVGDRIVALGRWIFDCGHPDPKPGTCSNPPDTSPPASCVLDSDCASGSCVGAVFNYRSELHPPQAVAVIRPERMAALSPAPVARGPAVPVTRADVYVSGDGGGAGDLCVVTVKPTFAEFLNPQPPCFPLGAPLASVNAVDFEFDVPLPAGRGPAVDVRLVPRDLPAGAVPARLELQQVLDASPPHLRAIVHMTERDGSGRLPTGFAGTLLAGWRGAPAHGFDHVRLTLESVTVIHALKDPPAPGLPVKDGWAMEASLGGEWQQIAGLEGVDAGSDGATFPLGASFDALVPRGATLPFFASAASRACNDLLFGQSLAEDLAFFGNDLAAAFACLGDRKQKDAGAVTLTIGAPPGPSPVRSRALADGGAWQLAYRVERVAGP